ncbi:autotransporter domain-containing protein [Stenotrophomonas indicatrix]|nr:autotransporter domain-containing protein [Stenotrophomonas indicatrix]WGV56767.1 autotransporter domain-containing protein [Stenotrophomonas indicatrix]
MKGRVPAHWWGVVTAWKASALVRACRCSRPSKATTASASPRARALSGRRNWATPRNNGERITPRARVVWQKELGDTQARYSTGFAAAPDLVFGASSQTVGEQVLAWNLGVTSRATDRLSVMVDYVGERRDGQLQNGVMLGLGYTF